MEKATLKIQKNNDGIITSIETVLPILKTYPIGIQKASFTVRCPILKTLGYSMESMEDAINDHMEDIDTFFDMHIQEGTLITALTSVHFEFQKVSDDEYHSPILSEELIKNATMINHTYRSNV